MIRYAKDIRKPESLSSLIKEADEIFSKYIRARDRDETYDFCLTCFTCGKIERTEWAHAMHYIDRDQMATRYDEINVHGGCEECNCFDPNHKEKYHAAMIHKYGEYKVNELIKRSKSLQKFMRHELEDLIVHYKEELKKLRKP
jgi:hypothetical protein